MPAHADLAQPAGLSGAQVTQRVHVMPADRMSGRFLPSLPVPLVSHRAILAGTRASPEVKIRARRLAAQNDQLRAWSDDRVLGICSRP